MIKKNKRRIWKPVYFAQMGELLPAFHWPYYRSFMRRGRYTAVFPLAIVLGLLVAIYQSFKEFWLTTILERDEK